MRNISVSVTETAGVFSKKSFYKDQKQEVTVVRGNQPQSLRNAPVNDSCVWILAGRDESMPVEACPQRSWVFIFLASVHL